MRPFSALATAALIALATWGPPAGPAVAAAAPAQRGVYLALGDSLANGIGATDPTRLGYVPRLFHFYRGAAHGGVDALENLGVNGATSGTLIAGGQLAGALAVINDPTTDVRVVTLDIGGNDLLVLFAPGSPCSADPNGLACRQALGAALATFASNYAFILAKLTAALAADPGDETILVMTYYNRFSGTGNPAEAVTDRLLLGPDVALTCAAPQATWGLNDIIACVGAQHGAAVADVHPRFVGKAPALTHVAEGGDPHPNNAGYAIIANTFMRASRS